MTVYTPQMKKNIQDALKKMNEDIKGAKEQIKVGKYAEAAKTVAGLIDTKHDAVTSFPPIAPKPGVILPFFPIFDLFEEIDREASHILDLLDISKSDAAALDRYIAKLKVLIEELQRQLIGRPQLGEAIDVKFINKIIEELRKLIQQATDGKGPNAKSDQAAHVATLSSLRQEKHNYLALFPSAFDLAAAYDALFLIDEALWYCLPYLQNPERIDQAIIDRMILQLDNAEHLKKHVEGLVEKSVAKDE